MKTRQLIAALCLFTVGGSALAGESCSMMRKINGVLTDVPVPCSTLDRPVACTKTVTNEKGWQTIETVPCEPRKQKTVQQVEREELAAQKRKCGKDFQALRVGMTLERYEECTDGVIFMTETVSKGAVVETYRSTFYFIHARDGRIVAFTRRTH